MKCGDDEALGPALQLYGGDFIDSDVTVAPGAILKFSWHATKGDAKLESMTITRDNIALANWNEKEIPNSANESYSDTAVLEAPLNEGSYTHALIVTDKDGLTATQSVVITVDPALGGDPISHYSAVLMGGLQNTEYGSFLDAEEGEVHLIGSANSNQSLIDMVYYYGSQNNATLCAPNDPTVNGGSGNFDVCENWTQKNATTFGSTTISASDFDDIVNDTEISEISGLSATKMTALVVGNVIAFETQGNKKGLVKVTALENSNSGTITIEVKIQQ
jgi:hypothetical protein